MIIKIKRNKNKQRYNSVLWKIYNIIMGIGTNIISAGIIGHFMPVEGVTLETLF